LEYNYMESSYKFDFSSQFRTTNLDILESAMEVSVALIKF